MRRFFVLALFVSFSAACVSHQVYGDLAETYTTHGLTADLQAAVPAYVQASHAAGYEVVWVGVSAEDYKLEPGGAPPRKIAKLTALARRPADDKCYGQDGLLVRVNQGGDTYGPPQIDAALGAEGKTPADFPDSGGFEFRCSAIDRVQGGIRLDRPAPSAPK